MTQITMSNTVTQFNQTYTSGQTYTLRSREAKQIIKAANATASKSKRQK